MISGRTSCIVLNYNDYETTQRLLSSVQNYTALDSIVVVDNCSPDGSYEKLLPFAGGKVHVISSGRNGGYGFGNNVGMRYASERLGADFCLIANPDVQFSNEIVEALTGFMREHDDCAIVTAVQNGDVTRSVWRETGVLGHLVFDSILLNLAFRPRYYPKSHFECEYAQVFSVSGCFFLARLRAMEEIGFYDEEFFLYEEENCLATKLKAARWNSYILPGLDFRHVHGVSVKKSIKGLGASKKMVLKSNELFLRKYKGVSASSMAAIKVYYQLCIAEAAVWDLVQRALHI